MNSCFLHSPILPCGVLFGLVLSFPVLYLLFCPESCAVLLPVSCNCSAPSCHCLPSRQRIHPYSKRCHFETDQNSYYYMDDLTCDLIFGRSPIDLHHTIHFQNQHRNFMIVYYLLYCLSFLLRILQDNCFRRCRRYWSRCCRRCHFASLRDSLAANLVFHLSNRCYQMKLS